MLSANKNNFNVEILFKIFIKKVIHDDKVYMHRYMIRYFKQKNIFPRNRSLYYLTLYNILLYITVTNGLHTLYNILFTHYIYIVHSVFLSCDNDGANSGLDEIVVYKSAFKTQRIRWTREVTANIRMF